VKAGQTEWGKHLRKDESKDLKRGVKGKKKQTGKDNRWEGIAYLIETEERDKEFKK